MLPIGSHFSATALSAIKSELKTNLGIDNTRYGVLSSSVSIINTLFPILGGIFIDMFGSIWGTIVVNIFVIIGSLLTALGAKYTSFPLMVVGRVVFGIGSGLIVTMQESLLSKWFRTQSLAIAIGLQLSISRLASFLGTIASNPVAQDTGDWVWPFWLALILCGFSMVMNIIYALIVRHLSGNNVLNKKDVMKLKAKKSFSFALSLVSLCFIGELLSLNSSMLLYGPLSKQLALNLFKCTLVLPLFLLVTKLVRPKLFRLLLLRSWA